MKRFLLFAGLAAAALSFVGCNKEADVRVLGKRTAELRLSTVDTRTINDGMNTLWAEDDSLTVFYAPAGTSTWSENTPFAIDDANAGLAKGEVELTEDAYDWYLFYPYTEYLVNPTGKDATGDWAGYFYVGSSSKGSQKQDGLNSMEHVAGKRVPLVGRVTNVAADQTPEVTMKHLSTLLKIDVINTYEEPITIQKITFTAPTDIVGSAYLDFSGDEPNLVPSEGFIGKTAQLTVVDAEPLASDKYASFYLAVMPFTVEYGDVMTLEVVASEGTYTAEVTAKNDYTFAAGHMKTLNVWYEKPDLETITVADMVTAATEGKSFSGDFAGATVTFVSGKYAFMQDDTRGILVFMTDHGLSAGDYVSGAVTGTGTTYKNLPEITSFTYPTPTTVTVPDPIEITLSELLANFDSYISRYVKLTGVTATSAFSSRKATLKDGDDTIQLYDQIKNLTIEKGGTYDIIGFPCVYNDTKQMGVWNQDSIIEISGGSSEEEGKIEVPRYNVSIYVDDTYDLEATTNSTATMTFVSDDPSIASVSDSGIVTGVAEGTTTITITLPAVPGSFTGNEATINITVKAKGQDAGGDWVATPASSLKDGDQFIYVATTTKGTYAMSNDASGSKKQPVAVAVEVSGEKLVSAPENAIWTLEKSGEYLVFHNTDATWLYSTNDNNGLRVGSSDTKNLYFDEGFLTINDTAGNARNIGIYLSNLDWRSYKRNSEGNINSNISDQTFTFYVKQ